MSESSAADSRRVFLALWPDAATRQALYRSQQQLAEQQNLRGARAVAQENLHMTLHFLGSVREQTVECLVQALDTVECPAFELDIDRSGGFARARVVWLGASVIPDGLHELVQRTRDCVDRCIEHYRCNPFAAHITLFRKARFGRQLADTPVAINWKVQSFALIESKTWAQGVEYSVLKQWTLRP